MGKASWCVALLRLVTSIEMPTLMNGRREKTTVYSRRRRKLVLLLTPPPPLLESRGGSGKDGIFFPIFNYNALTRPPNAGFPIMESRLLKTVK